VADNLAFHAQHRGGRGLLAHPDLLDGNELARLHSSLELLPELGNRGLLHATVERRFQDAAPVLDPHWVPASDYSKEVIILSLVAALIARYFLPVAAARSLL